MNRLWNLKVLFALLLLAGWTGAASAGVIGYWDFNEGSGTTLYDASAQSLTGSPNNGTITGTLTWTSGYLGTDGALQFPGNQANYVSMPRNGALGTMGTGTGAARSFTVSIREYETGVNNYGELYCFGTNRGLYYQTGNGTGVQSYFWSDNATNYQWSTGYVIPLNTWKNILFSYDGGANTLRMYVDGALRNTKTGVNQALNISGNLFIGRAGGSQNQNWIGKLDDMLALNNAASAADATAIYNGTYAPLTVTWQGGGADTNWMTGGNWLGIVPGRSRPVSFGGANTTNNNNFAANTQFGGLTFNSGASAFTLSGNNANLTGNVTNNSATLQTIGLNLVLDGGNRTFNAAAGDLAVSNPITEAQAGRGLTKSGAYALTLNGTSTYSGPTAVNAGKLLLNTGAALSNSAATVTGGSAILAGNGSVGQLLTAQSGGHLAPGIDASTLGTLAAGAGLSLSGANLDIKAAAPGTSDLINVTGNLSLSGTSYLNLTQLAGFGIGDYGFLSYTGSLSGGGSIQAPANTPTYNYKINTSVVGSTTNLLLHVYAPLPTLKWNGNVDGAWDIDTTANWLNGAAPANYQETADGSSPVIFDDSATGTTAVTLANLVQPASVTFSNTSAKSYTVSGIGGIGGNTGLTVDGGGSVTLNNQNGFTGDTVVSNSSTLTLGHVSALGGSTLNYNNQGGTLSFGALTEANLGGLKGAQSLALQNASSAAVELHVGGNDQDNSYSGTLSGPGSLVKDGLGTMTLAADAAHTGATTVNLGTLTATTLSATSAVSVPTGTLNVQSYNAAATLNVGLFGTANVSGADLSLAAVTNSGALSFTAASGTTTLAGLSGGGTTSFTAGAAIPEVSGGTVNVGGVATVGTASGGVLNLSGATATVTTLAGGTVNSNTGTTVTIDGGSGALTGTASLVKNTAGTLTVTGVGIYTGGTTFNAGTVSTAVVPGGAMTFNGGTWQFTGSLGSKDLVDAGSSNQNIDVTSGQLTVTHQYRTIVKSGAGTMVVANTYYQDGGNVQVDDGTLVLAGSTNIGGLYANIGSITDVKPSATVKMGDLHGGQVYYDYSFNMSGGTYDVNGLNPDLGGYNPQGNQRNCVPAIAGSGTITNSAPATGVAVFKINGTKTFSGDIVDGAGKVAVYLTNAGGTTPTWVLSGNNTYSGDTRANAGTMKAGATTAFSPNSAFTVGGTLDLAGYSNTIAALSGGGTVQTTGGLATLTVNNDSATSNLDTTFSGVIRNNGLPALSLTKTGDKMLTLSGANTYTGETTINAGVLRVNRADVAGTSGALGVGGNILFGGGTLRFMAASAGVDWANRLNGSASPMKLDTDGQTVTFGGVGSAIGGTNTGGLQKLGAGTLVLAGENTYTGDTVLAAGSLQVAAAETPATSGPLGASGTIGFAGGTLQYSAANTHDYSARFSTAASQAYRVDTNGQAVSFATALSSVGGSLTVSDSASGGVLTLPGAHTYNGPTAVNSGTLALSDTSTNNIAASSSIAVGGGATLSATGLSGGTIALAQPLVAHGAGIASVTGSVDAGGQTLDLMDGTNLGTLAVSSALTLGGGGTLKFDLGNSGANNDLVAVTGAASMTGTTTVDVNALTGLLSLLTGSQAYTLVTAGSGLSNSNFALSSSSIIVNGTTYQLSLSGDANNEWLGVSVSTNNDSKLWVGATEPTASMETTSVTVPDFGRVMKNTTVSTAVTLNSNGAQASTTNASLTPSSDAASATASPILGFGGVATVDAGINTASTGVKSGTITIDNLAADSAGTGVGSDNGNATINVSGTVLADRVVTAGSTVALGVKHVGASVSQGITLSTASGDDNNATRVTVGNAGPDGNGLSVSGGTNPTFNSNAVTDSRTLSGTLSALGALSGTITLTAASAENGGAGLPGEAPQNVPVNYTATVYSGKAEWNVAGNGAWGTDANWKDTMSAVTQGAPGTAGFSGDSATFAGSVTGLVTVSLNAAAPTVAGVAFNNAGAQYTVAQGTGSNSLTLDNGLLNAPVVVAAGQHSITAPVVLNSNAAVTVTNSSDRLTLGAVSGSGGVAKAGAGKLVINGNNFTTGYNGGTSASQGVVQLDSANALRSGSNLTLTGTARASLGGSTTVNLGNAVVLGDLNINSHATSGLTAALDMNKSKAIVDKTQIPLATLRAQIKSAYAAGQWSGAGITSGAAAADRALNGNAAKTGVGYLDNGVSPAAGGGKTSWQGRTGLNSNSLLVRYTYYGDANLDGSVNLADFGILKANYGTGNQWYQGDFDYSGTIGLADFGKLKAAYGSPAITAAEGQAVPEPSAIALAISGGLAAAGLWLRRRRGR